MVLVKSNIKHYNDPRYIVYSSSLRLAPLALNLCVQNNMRKSASQIYSIRSATKTNLCLWQQMIKSVHETDAR